MSRLDEIEARLNATWRPDTYVPVYDQSRWGQCVVSITRCRDKPLTTLEFMPHTMGDVSYAELLAHAGDDLWFLHDRVRELEAGLREYGRHHINCTYVLRATPDGVPSDVCDCGYDALAGDAK